MLFLVPTIGLVFEIAPGCRQDPKPDVQAEARQMKSIDDVIRAHADSLMAIPGVVGVYQGLDEHGSTCLKVMVKKKSPEIESKIPRRLEGYPVEVEETGEIRPME